MGPCAWLGILHPAAAALDATNIHRAEATRRLTKLMQAIQRVFPCKSCRAHIMMNWGVPRVQKSMQKLMYNFHDRVNQMLDKTSPSFESMRRRNHQLLESHEWRKWMYAFLLYSSANCMPMMQNVEGSPCNMMRDMRGLVSAMRRCGLDVKPMEPQADGGANCNSVWHTVDQYVRRENGRSVDRNVVLQARVNCAHHKKGGNNIADLL